VRELPARSFAGSFHGGRTSADDWRGQSSPQQHPPTLRLSGSAAARRGSSILRCATSTAKGSRAWTFSFSRCRTAAELPGESQSGLGSVPADLAPQQQSRCAKPIDPLLRDVDSQGVAAVDSFSFSRRRASTVTRFLRHFYVD